MRNSIDDNRIVGLRPKKSAAVPEKDIGLLPRRHYDNYNDVCTRWKLERCFLSLSFKNVAL